MGVFFRFSVNALGEIQVEQNINRETIPGPIQLVVVASDSDADVQQRNMDAANITIYGQSIYLSVCLSTCLFSCLPMSLRLSACPRLSVCLPVHLSVCQQWNLKIAVFFHQIRGPLEQEDKYHVLISCHS